jgi:transcriptional regulator of aromatic amino acid metabolism
VYIHYILNKYKVNILFIQFRAASQLPPLRQRREDIEFLARFFMARFATEQAAQAARLLGAVGRGQSRDAGGTARAMMRRLGARP